MTAELAVNEVFETFQGEAFWTGTPAIFIRLQGCDVGCPWCDTKHTWPVDPMDRRPLHVILEKFADAKTYALVTAPLLAAAVLKRFSARHAVITGGEPCRFDLTELCEALAPRCMVQIETSGTEEIRVPPATWVTVSPKIDMPGGLAVRQDALERADEIKMPVGKRADVDKLDALLKRMAPDQKPGATPKFVPVPTNDGEPGHATPPLIWLQPLSQSPKATDICFAVARERGWRVSLQTHKFLGVR